MSTPGAIELVSTTPVRDVVERRPSQDVPQDLILTSEQLRILVP